MFLSRLMGRLCSNYTVNFLVFSVDISKPLAGFNKGILCKPQRTILSNGAKMRKSICFHFKSVQLHRTSKEDAMHLTQTDKGESVLGEIRALERSCSSSVTHQVAHWFGAYHVCITRGLPPAMGHWSVQLWTRLCVFVCAYLWKSFPPNTFHSS